MLQSGKETEHIVLMEAETLGQLGDPQFLLGPREGLEDIECMGYGLDQIVHFLSFH
jgi:hypothetical protein